MTASVAHGAPATAEARQSALPGQSSRIFRGQSIYLHPNLGEKRTGLYRIITHRGGTVLLDGPEPYVTYVVQGVHDPDFPNAVSTQWVNQCIEQERIVPGDYYRTDPRCLFSGAVICFEGLSTAHVSLLRLVVSTHGGQWRREMTRDTTHLVAASTLGMQYDFALHYKSLLNIHIVSPDWIHASLRVRHLLPESPYELPEPSGSAQEASDHPVSDTALAPQKPLDGRRIFLSESLDWPHDIQSVIQERIVAAGASCLVCEEASSFADGDIVIVERRQSRDFWAARAQHVTTATPRWLLSVLARDSFCDPASELLFVPMPPLDQMPPQFQALDISITNYSGASRDFLRALMTTLGASFSGSVTRHTSLLISNGTEGIKFKYARLWGVPIVSHRWLQDCFQRIAFLDFDEYGPLDYGMPLVPPAQDLAYVEAHDNHPAALADRSKYFALVQSPVAADSENAETSMAHTENAETSMARTENAETSMARTENAETSMAHTENSGSPVADQAAPGPTESHPVDSAPRQFASSSPPESVKREATDNLPPVASKKPRTHDSQDKESPEPSHLHVPDDHPTRSRARRSAAADAQSKLAVQGSDMAAYQKQLAAHKARSGHAPPPPLPESLASEESPSADPNAITIMTTGLSVRPRLLQFMESCGCIITSDPARASHLVVKGISRTANFLTALAYHPTIVTVAWLEQSFKQKKLLDPSQFPLRDPAKETTFKMSLDVSLERARQAPLFQGLTFFLTKGLVPSPDVLSGIIKAAHGTTVVADGAKLADLVTKRVAATPEDVPADFFVISSPSEHSSWKKVSPLVPVYSAESILISVLRQEHVFSEEFQLNV